MKELTTEKIEELAATYVLQMIEKGQGEFQLKFATAAQAKQFAEKVEELLYKIPGVGKVQVEYEQT